MDSKELSNKLKDEGQKLIPLIKEMDILYEKIKNEMPNGAEAWIRHQVKYNIEHYPEFTKSLGNEKLGDFKKKLDKLIFKLPSLIQNEFADKNNWPQYKKEEPSNTYVYKQAEFHINAIFRNVVSNVALLLDEYGFLQQDQSHIKGWEKIGVKIFRYRFGIDNDNLPSSLVEEYRRLLAKYNHLNEEINNTKSELSKVEAIEMWEKV